MNIIIWLKQQNIKKLFFNSLLKYIAGRADEPLNNSLELL